MKVFCELSAAIMSHITLQTNQETNEQNGGKCIAIDIYPIDTVLPVHIVWHDEATAKSTTQDGGMAETYICGRKLRLMQYLVYLLVST